MPYLSAAGIAGLQAGEDAKSERLAFAKRAARRRQTGQALLLGYAVAMAIFMVMLAGVLEFGMRQMSAVRANATAQSMKPLVASASTYINQYSTEITSLLTPGGPPVVIPFARTAPGLSIPEGPVLSGGGFLPSIQGAGFLPPSYVDRDGYGQSHDLVILEPITNDYEALILSVGGTEVSNTALGQIAADFPGIGGGIPSAAQGTPAAELGQIDGVGRSWHLSLASLNISSTLATPGHYAILLPTAMSAGRLDASNYMSRYDASNGAGNSMTTDILMNGNSVTGVNAVALANGATVSEPTAGTLALSAPTSVQGSVSVAANMAMGSNLSVDGTLGSGTLSATTGSVSGNATAGSSTVSGAVSVAPTSSTSANDLTVAGGMSAAAVSVANTLNATTSATSTGASTFGTLGVSGNMTVKGGALTAAQLIPTGTAVQGAACSNPGAYEYGTYTDIAGRTQTAELFCEPSTAGDVWMGGVAEAGYAEQMFAQPSCPAGDTGSYVWSNGTWVDECVAPAPPPPTYGYLRFAYWTFDPSVNSWVVNHTTTDEVPYAQYEWEISKGYFSVIGTYDGDGLAMATGSYYRLTRTSYYTSAKMLPTSCPSGNPYGPGSNNLCGY